MDATEKEKIFHEIRSRFGNAIKSTCAGFVRDYNDRNDLQQEVWLNIWSGLDRLRNRDVLPTWTYRVTRNTALSYLKEKRRLHPLNGNECEMGDQHPCQDNMEYEIAYQEVFGLFHEAVMRLDMNDRIIIDSYLNQDPYCRIASLTGYSEVNVRVRLHRSKGRIRNIMEHHPGYNSYALEMVV